MQSTDDAVRVPLNRAKFQKYRNLNVILAGLGLSMVLLVLAGFVYSLYSAFGHVDFWWLLNVILFLWLVAFIGMATMPAWHLAQINTKTLKTKAPAIIVDDEGIQDNVSNYALGFIPWAEVESVSVISRYAPSIKQTFPGFALVLKDKNMILRKKPRVMAMWMQADN